MHSLTIVICSNKSFVPERHNQSGGLTHILFLSCPSIWAPSCEESFAALSPLVHTGVCLFGCPCLDFSDNSGLSLGTSDHRKASAELNFFHMLFEVTEHGEFGILAYQKTFH